MEINKWLKTTVNDKEYDDKFDYFVMYDGKGGTFYHRQTKEETQMRLSEIEDGSSH